MQLLAFVCVVSFRILNRKTNKKNFWSEVLKCTRHNCKYLPNYATTHFRARAQSTALAGPRISFRRPQAAQHTVTVLAGSVAANRAPYPDEIDSGKTRAPPVSISVRGRVAPILLKLRRSAISALYSMCPLAELILCEYVKSPHSYLCLICLYYLPTVFYSILSEQHSLTRIRTIPMPASWFELT